MVIFKLDYLIIFLSKNLGKNIRDKLLWIIYINISISNIVIENS